MSNLSDDGMDRLYSLWTDPLLAKIKALQADNDELQRRINVLLDDLKEMADESEQDAVARIRAENEANAAKRDAARMREALTPFQQWAQHKLLHGLPASILADDETPVLGDRWIDKPEITVGDIKTLAALSPTQTETDEE